MGNNYNYYYCHSSIPYHPKVGSGGFRLGVFGLTVVFLGFSGVLGFQRLRV